ncbi:hypothetical protein E4U43_003520 [Claviceps pusilla]|uniref:Stress activated map kinase interacting n=1 Tax=Claviceps pusilla TaxID=123648 RepID=A0A9P7SVB3_9HYPO|nr:hypothetical protein E4U43_003520 [Claviceps pusilla]
MGLVDYDSDSASGSEAPSSPKPTPIPTLKPTSQASSKKPFRKVVDRSNPGKIVVSLPTLTSDTTNNNSNEPPAKRPRTTSGGGLFSGFNSFLPPPKNTGRNTIKPSGSSSSSSSRSSALRPGVNLKTSAAPGFSRDGGEDEVLSQQFVTPTSTSASTSSSSSSSSSISDLPGPRSTGLSLPPPRRQEAMPSIPEGQKPAEEVTLVGKPLMFRPLSVGLNAKKKKKTMMVKNKIDPHPTATPQNASDSIPSREPTDTAARSIPADARAPVPQKKKVSLFSLHTEDATAAAGGGGGATAGPFMSPANEHDNEHDNYQPLFETAYHQADASSTEYWALVADEERHGALAGKETPPPTTTRTATSLDHMADDLNLSAAARRELFGRDGSNFAAKTVVNFNMDKEYEHNEHVRASGDQQMHHPVRALQSGKHSLKQLVQNVQNQKDALEDSFAKGRSNRKEASSRYGW